MYRFHLLAALILFFTASSSAQEIGEAVFSLDSLLSLPVSTASKYKQTTTQTPASISVITSADIENFQYTTLAEILNRVRGLYTSDDRNYSYAGIRGFSRPIDHNNRILLLVDGHTMNGNTYGEAQIGSEFGLPLDAIDRIEIVRGPSATIYGTGAMFGIVNVITKDYQTADYLTASGSLGGYGYKNASLQYGKQFTHGSGIFVAGNIGSEDGADIYFPEYDTEFTNHGIATNVDWNNYYGATAKLTLQNFVIKSGISSRKKAIPTASFFTQFNDSRARTIDARQFIDASYTASPSDVVEVSARLYGDRKVYECTRPYAILSLDETTGMWWGSEVRALWDAASNNRLAAGIEFQDHKPTDANALSGSMASSVTSAFRVLSVYLQNEFQWGSRISITGGVRYDHHSLTGGTFSPRLAVHWNEIEGGVIKFLVGKAFRNPNVYELYLDNPLLGVKSNPSLSSELMTTWELAIEQRLTKHLQASASFYSYSMTNLIDLTKNPTDLFYRYENISSVDARGIECELEYQPNQTLHCYAVFSTQMAENAIQKTRMTNSPSWLGRAGVFYKFNSLVQASVEGSYDSERLTVKGTNTPAFTLLHAKVILSPIAEGLHLSLCARNLLDTKYELPAGVEHVQAAIPQPGRQFIVKTECSF